MEKVGILTELKSQYKLNDKLFLEWFECFYLNEMKMSCFLSSRHELGEAEALQALLRDGEIPCWSLVHHRTVLELLLTSKPLQASPLLHPLGQSASLVLKLWNHNPERLEVNSKSL